MRIRKDCRRYLIFLAVLVPSTLLSSAAIGDKHLDRLEARAESGSVKDQLELARAYMFGRGVIRDEKIAAKWYEKAANFGDTQAQRTIAYLYEMGFGVPRDPVRASRWLERAMAGGSLDAKVDLALKYLHGSGVKRDLPLALDWLRAAAFKGHGRAATDLGDMYHLGIGLPADDANARHWYELGVRRKDPLAQYRLGVLLCKAESDRPSLARAAALLRKASAAGVVRAKYSLGLLLNKKPDLASSAGEQEAVLKVAAKAGVWKASHLLGRIALSDKTAQPGSKRAFFWFEVASLQGREDAGLATRPYLEQLKKELTLADANELASLAESWFKHFSAPVQIVLSTHDNSGSQFSYALAPPVAGFENGKIVVMPTENGPATPF